MGFLILADAFILCIVFDFNEPKHLEVVFFNVGQGDAAFVETPNRQQVLIDGGPNSLVLKKLAKVMPFYDHTLDLVILTHPEKDHLTGLLEVLKRYQVKNILWTGIVRETAEYREWERLIKEEGARVIIAGGKQRIVLQEKPGIFIDILYPSQGLEGKIMEDSNDSSVIVRFSFGNDSLLFTGDASSKIEDELSGQDLASTVLKIAHHGSKTSTSEKFLEEVSPETAVISVGENSYGHPTPEVLARLQKFDINVLITKINGDIKIVSSGNNF